MASDSPATSPSAHSDSTALLATVATLTLATSSALLWHARKPHYFSPSPSSSSLSLADDSERTRTLLDTLSSFIPIRVLRLASHRPIPVPQLPPSQQATNSDPSSPSSSGPSQSKSSRSKDRRKRGKDASAKDIRKLNHLLKPSKPPPSSSTGPLVLDDPFEHPRVIPLPPSPCPSPVSVPRKQRRVSPLDEDQTPIASPDADGPGLIVSPAASASAPSASTSAVASAGLAILPPSVATSLSSPQPRRHRSASRTSSSEDYDSHALSSHSHSQPPSLPLSPSMPPQTQIASLRGALEASRIREDKNRAEAERLGRELDAARWQAREDAHAWRKRESDLQGYIHYLSQSLHFSTQAHHHPHHHQPTFAYPLSPPFSPGAIYSAPPPPAPAPVPMAPSPGALSPSALELARSFPPPPSSASASSGGGSPDRGRRLARQRLHLEGVSSASSASDEGEEYECEDEMPSEEIADAILKRPEGFLGRRSSASSSAAGAKSVGAAVQRPELGELRFPSIEDWGNVWGIGGGKRADVVDEEVVVEVGFDDEDEMMEREGDEEEEEVTPDGVQTRE